MKAPCVTIVKSPNDPGEPVLSTCHFQFCLQTSLGYTLVHERNFNVGVDAIVHYLSIVVQKVLLNAYML